MHPSHMRLTCACHNGDDMSLRRLIVSFAVLMARQRRAQVDAGEESPYALESKKSLHALLLVARNKRIAAELSGSLLCSAGCRSCFARERRWNYPLGRAFTFAGLLAGAGSERLDGAGEERLNGEEFFMPFRALFVIKRKFRFRMGQFITRYDAFLEGDRGAA
jgi:hypothetical protein